MITTAPQVIDAVVALVPDAPNGEYLVIDGWPDIQEHNKTICIGFTFDPDTPAVSTNVDLPQSGMKRCKQRESYNIQGEAIVWDGSTNQKFVRDEAYALFDILHTAINNDSTLGGLVMSARATAYNLVQGQMPEGAIAYISFQIDVETFTNG